MSHGEGGVLKGPISVTYYSYSPKLKMAILHNAKDFTRKKYDYLTKFNMYFSIRIIKILRLSVFFSFSHRAKSHNFIPINKIFCRNYNLKLRGFVTILKEFYPIPEIFIHLNPLN